MNQNPINIAYALNDKYAEMTCVSMCSVITNCENSEIVFHLFAEDLSLEQAERISVLSAENVNIRIELHNIRIDGELFVTADYTGLGAPNLTKEAYAPIMMPDLLPDLERLLFLDCDTIIEGNAAEIWQADLGGFLVGMAPDYSLTPKELKKQILGMGESDVYYNTGVILMDIAGLRRFGLPQIVKENVARLYKQSVEAELSWFADQDVLNYALRGKIKKLPMRYNSYFWQSLPLGESIEECIEAYLNPVIVHFIGTPKPTELGNVPVNLPEWERYYKYKAMTPYANDADEIRTALQKKREENTLEAFMPVFDENTIHWYSFHFAKQMFALAAKRYRLTVNGKKIVVWGLNNRTWTLAVYLAAHGMEVKGIVDGLESNHGIRVFYSAVEPPEILRGTVGDTFVMLDMRNYDIARQVMAELRSWGYSEDDFCYVYAPIWEGTGALGESTAISRSS